MDDMPLDAIDRRLLAQLQQDARATAQALSEAAHLSPAQSNRRHRRLEEAGVIQRYEARLSAAALGLNVVAFVHVTMERGHVAQIADFKALIVDLPQVQECYAVTGDADYVLKVVARDLKSLSDFLMGTLMRAPGVGGVHSTVCLDEVKCSSALPLD